MTPLPKRRNSTGRSGRRQAAKFTKVVNLTKCPNCNQAIRPHSVCQNCGQYKKRAVLSFKNEKKG